MLNKTYFIDDKPGSLSNICEIKILICYVLRESQQTITQSQLNKVFQINETVNYFNFCQAMAELLTTNHVFQQNDNILKLTQLGLDAVELFEKNLPASTLKKSIKTLNELIEYERENKNRIIEINKKEDGYIVKLVLEETGSNLLNLEIFCPTEDAANKFKDELKNKTTDVYRTILAVLSNDHKTLIEIASNCKKLQIMEKTKKNFNHEEL